MAIPPYISVIVPTLNEADNIGPLVEHLRRYGDEEAVQIVIVDGGSEDGTCEKIPHGSAALLESDRGRAVQMNCGANWAAGEVFYFVHADSLPPASYQQDIEQAHGQGYAHGGYRFRFLSDRRIFRVNNFFTRFAFSWTRGGDQTYFITRELFEALHGFDERYVIMEEYDLMRRARRAGGKMKIFKKSVLGSARKYEYNSYLRVNLVNVFIYLAYRLGVSPAKLKRWYKAWLKTDPNQGIKKEAYPEG
ncbi:MAG TPA: glycosyl transferase [Cytophagales bacterium]|nr:glycosyl transferase [Cytophagales bacterium]HAA20119.1 glycosyl transferase [Cytophagales bacterium]HAP64074.1 glycosyl transferase [Cytophagales bacterium]